MTRSELIEAMARAYDDCPEWPARSYRSRSWEAALSAIEQAGLVVVLADRLHDIAVADIRYTYRGQETAPSGTEIGRAGEMAKSLLESARLK